ncbi:hypothetical protein H0Z60_01425 [Ectothiorhodospiraceae bacterium WFHF3C12]|nr:hypothetical protein [Ectothiorhodospiraceae bacterium WFHF3C12]
MQHLNAVYRRILLGSALALMPLVAAQAASGGEGEQDGEQTLLTEEEQARYERRMRQTLSEWRERVESATEAGSERAEELTEAGRRELNAVWDDAREDWRKLEEATGEAWQDSRRTFEQSMQALEKRWDALNSDDEGS